MVQSLNNKGYNAYSISVPSPSELFQIIKLAAPVFVTMLSKVCYISLVSMALLADLWLLPHIWGIWCFRSLSTLWLYILLHQWAHTQLLLIRFCYSHKQCTVLNSFYNELLQINFKNFPYSLGHDSNVQHVCGLGRASLSNRSIIHARVAAWSRSKIGEGRLCSLLIDAIFSTTTVQPPKHFYLSCWELHGSCYIDEYFADNYSYIFLVANFVLMWICDSALNG